MYVVAVRGQREDAAGRIVDAWGRAVLYKGDAPVVGAILLVEGLERQDRFDGAGELDVVGRSPASIGVLILGKPLNRQVGVAGVRARGKRRERREQNHPGEQ